MKFSFKKYKIKIMIIYLIFIILFFGIFYFYTLKDLFVAYLILIWGLVLLVKMIYYYYQTIKFLKKHSKKEIKEFEEEFNNILLKYKSCILTEKYIFDLRTYIYIKYSDIVCITPSEMVLATYGTRFTFGKKQILYLENNKRYVIKTSLFTSSSNFIKIVKKKNSNVFIGNINEYKKQKDKIKYIKKLKIKTKI